MLKPEPEQLAYLRHRFARLQELHLAYQTFRFGEVIMGPDKTIPTPMHAQMIAQTLMIQLYSFLYSMFDYHPEWKSVDFISIANKLRPDLDEYTVQLLDKIIRLWRQIRQPLKTIRNKVGFHQEDNREGARKGYRQFLSLHPLHPLLMIEYLRVFFRSLDFVYERSEPRLVHFSRENFEELKAYLEEFEQIVMNTPFDPEWFRKFLV